MQQSLFTYDITEIDKVSKIIIELIKQKNKVLFSGPVGSGKTTLIKNVIYDLGYKEHVASPTFSLINEYELDYKMIYHMDLYRINKIEELEEIGFFEYLQSGNLCFIEWGEIIEDMIGEDYNKFNLFEIGDLRILEKIK